MPRLKPDRNAVIDSVRQRVQRCNPDEVAQVSGCSALAIRRFARGGTIDAELFMLLCEHFGLAAVQPQQDDSEQEEEKPDTELWLRTLREELHKAKENGVSMTEIARRAGVPRSLVSGFLSESNSGSKTMYAGTFQVLCQQVGLELVRTLQPPTNAHHDS